MYLKILLTYFFGVFFGFSCQEADFLKNIKDSFKKIDKCIDGKDLSEAIIFIGNTKVGKSTTFNYVNDRKLTSVSQGLSCVLISDQSIDGAEIGLNPCQSQTILPINFGKYWDTPGIEDTRSDAYDVSTAYIFQRLFLESKKLKIILFTPEESLKSSKVEFTRLIRRIGQIFGEETTKNKIISSKSMGLVITKKTGLYGGVEVSQELKTMLSVNDSNFFSAEKDFLNFFINNCQSNINFFPAPNGVGNFSSDYKDVIKGFIENSVSYVDGIQPRFVLSDKCKMVCRNLLLRMTIDYDHLIKNLITDFSYSLKNKFKFVAVSSSDYRLRIDNSWKILNFIKQNNLTIPEFLENIYQLCINMQLQDYSIKIFNELSKAKIIASFSSN